MPGRLGSYNLWRRVHVTLACVVFPSATFLAGCGAWLLMQMYERHLPLLVIAALAIPFCIITFYATSTLLTPVSRLVARALAALAAACLIALPVSRTLDRIAFGSSVADTPTEELVVVAIGILALAWSLTPFPVTRAARARRLRPLRL